MLGDFKVYVRYGLYLVIRDLIGYFRSSEQVSYILSKNMEGRLK